MDLLIVGGRTMTGRVPPRSDDSEQALLGSILLKNGVISDVIEIVHSPSDFYYPANQKIFAAIISLYDKGQPADTTTVTAQLEKTGALEDCGGRLYLTGLADGVATAANAVQYAKIIKELAKLRSVIDVSMQTIDDCYTQREECGSLLETAEKRLLDISRDDYGTGPVSYAEMSADILSALQERIENRGQLPGLSTGFKELDRLLNGLKPGHLYIIAGRPSMGKTCLSQNILDNICQADPKVEALFISLEMPRLDVGKRSLCSNLGFSFTAAERGELSSEEIDRLAKDHFRFSAAKVYVDDSSTLTPLVLRAKIRRFARQHNLKILAVDYIQLMNAPGENQNLRIAEITRQLKAVAKEFNIPVVAVSQLSRGVEGRDNKRPGLGDLRDSGAIEQDADAVIFIYREEVYLRHLPASDSRRKSAMGKAEIMVSKNRNGPTGMIELQFNESSMRFNDLESLRSIDGPQRGQQANATL
jgi:replicative DNA helicase